jgi:hypothetical protein
LSDRWRWRGLAAALILIGCPYVAHAQTVIVKGAPEGTTVQLGLNGPVIATATADAQGLATLAMPAANAFTTETRIGVFIDRCPTARRIELADAGLTPPNDGGCARDTTTWVFLLRSESTLVIDIASNPLIRLAQGKPPDAWLRYGLALADVEAPWGPPPTGLLLGASTGFVRFADFSAAACGDQGCSSSKLLKPITAFSATYWLSQYVGAELQYFRPTKTTAAGEGLGFTFGSTLETEILSVAGEVAVPANRGRLFARAGMNRHATRMLNTETVSAVTRADGSIVPGGTFDTEFRTEGWGYMLGGGAEIWISRRLAISLDLSRAGIGGDIIALPETKLDQGVWLIQVGGKVRIF